MRPQGKAARTQAARCDAVARSLPEPANHSATGRQRGGKRQASSTATASTTSLTNLPIEVVQVIGSKLDVEDLRSCRLVCKLWALRLAQGVTKVSMCMHPDTAVAGRTLKQVGKLMPIFSSLEVHISNRQPQSSADFFLQQLQPVRHLRELQLVFRGLPGQEPKWPAAGTVRLFKSYKPLFALTQLTNLTIQDGVIPCGTEIASLTNLKSLTKLAFTSSDQHRAAMIDVYRGAAAEDLPGAATFAQMLVICTLRSLRHLEVPVTRQAAEKQSSWGLAQLSRLTSLTVHGPPFALDTNIIDLTMDDDSPARDPNLLTALPNVEELSITLPRNCDTQAAWGLDLDPATSKLRQVSLTVNSYFDVVADLAYMNVKLGHRLRKLMLRCNSLTPTEAHLLGDLKHLQHLDVFMASGNTPFSRIINSVAASTQLQALVISRPLNAHPVQDRELHASLAKLASSLGGDLEQLELEGIIDTDFEPGTQQVLKLFKRLRVLSLKCADNTRCKLPVSISALPLGLKKLKLRFAQLQGLTPRLDKWPSLSELTLNHCAPDNMRQFQAVIGNLRSLTGLHLENMVGLNDDSVARLSSLTGLTALSIMATTNQAVTNASLGALTTLVRLNKLVWHVGDMLDATPDVVTLKTFDKLLMLSLTTSMFYRLSRWGALNVMDFLPHCQVDTVGP